MTVIMIRGSSIDEIYWRGRQVLEQYGRREETRNGPAFALPGVTVTEHRRPRQRVLFERGRRANPFFHLIEAVWMLAGWRNGSVLDRYVSDFTARFAEPGSSGILHGAYGSRWRNRWDADQLLAVGEMLRSNPGTRRAVVQMWDPDLDLGAAMRDLPCNTQLLFRAHHHELTNSWVLDMTVVNRSNDMVWGAYGANAVHMSIVHEVVAGLAGMRMGTMYTMSNNMHAYLDVLQRMPTPESLMCLYDAGTVWAMPIFDAGSPLYEQAQELLPDCERFMGWLMTGEVELIQRIRSPWLLSTVLPMARTHQRGRENGWASALEFVDTIAAQDWRHAAKIWIEARIRSAEAKKDIAAPAEDAG